MWAIWASGACDRKTVGGVCSTISWPQRFIYGMITTENTESTEKYSVFSVLSVVDDNVANDKL
jgi:hypothetical protein